MNQRKTYERERFNVNLARLKIHGKNIEINIEPDLAIKYKQGKSIDIKDILKSQNIFFDVKDGELASETFLKEVFNTSDVLTITKTILNKGEIQLTQEYRKKLLEQKKKLIVDKIHRICINPKTNLPHPITRIQNAFDELKIKIDYYKSVDDQINSIVKKLQKIIPIKIENLELEFDVVQKYAHEVFKLVPKFGKLNKTNWLSDGSLWGIAEIPAGLRDDFFNTMNKVTKGSIIIRLKNN